MKSQMVIAVLFVLLGCFGAQAAVGGYDYCGKPCTDVSSLTCASNGFCFEIFMTKCEMKKSNCDLGTTFNEQPMSNCLLGVKC